MPPSFSASRRSLETFAAWGLVGTLAVSLLVFIPSAAIPFSFTKSFVLVLGGLAVLALYILSRLSRGSIILPPLVLVGALWLPAIAYALSALFSGGSFANALWGASLGADTLGFMLAAALLGTLGALVLRRGDQLKQFFSLGIGAIALLVLAQFLVLIIGNVSPETLSPAFSLAGSRDDLAFVLGLGAIGLLLAMRFIEVPERIYRAGLVLGAAILFLLAVANSTLVWTLVAAVALGLFVEAVMKRRAVHSDAELDGATVVGESLAEPEAVNSSLVLPLVTLAVALFFLIGGTLGGALAQSLGIQSTSVTPSWSATLAVAQNTYGESALFGSGPGSFGEQWIKYRDASLNTTIFWNVDFTSGVGYLPTALVTTGAVGAVAWAALLVLFLFYGVRMLVLRAPKDPYIRFAAVLSFVAALYVFIVATFGLPGAPVLALGFVFAGIFASILRYEGAGTQWGVVFSRSPRLGFLIVFALTLLLLASIAAVYGLVERYIAGVSYTRAASALSAGDLDLAESSVARASAFAPTAAAYNLESQIANARIAEVVSSTTLSASAAQQAFQAALSSGINAALTATQLAPRDYRHWVALGNTYAQAVPLKIEGAYDSAKTAYEQARALNPTSPQILYLLAQLDIAQGDSKRAQEVLKEAIALKQDYTAAIFLLSQLQVENGEVTEALASAEAAAYFTPNNPSILFQVGILRAASGNFSGAAAALSAAIDANPQFANARYFLAAVYARQGLYAEALAQVETIASFSAENAEALASQIEALENERNPFPANLLTLSGAPGE